VQDGDRVFVTYERRGPGARNSAIRKYRRSETASLSKPRSTSAGHCRTRPRRAARPTRTRKRDLGSHGVQA
jgi:hypothetical protein